MARMVTTAPHQYYGRRLHAGDEYDCEDQLVELMGKMGWARPKQQETQPAQQVLEEQPNPPEQQGQIYQTRDMVAASPRGSRRRK